MEIRETVDKILARGKKEIAKSSSAEGIGLSKVVDLGSIKFLTYANWFRNLESILSDGILSRDLAIDRGKTEVKSVYGFNPLNRRYVSLMPGDKVPFPGEIIFIVKEQLNSINLSDEDTSIFPFRPTGEHLVKDKVRPEEFLGLGFFGNSSDENLQRVLDVVLKMWENRPHNALPIYDLADKSLLWPRRMTHEEIMQMLAEKKQV